MCAHGSHEAHPREYLEKGDMVSALFLATTYFPARVSNIYDDGSISVIWEDGDQRDTLKTIREIIFQDRPDGKTSSVNFTVGEYAEAYSKSRGDYRNCMILGLEGGNIRIKWIPNENDSASHETSKSTCLVRKILNHYPSNTKFRSFESVLALDMQQMNWRPGTILRVVRDNVYKIAWEKYFCQGHQPNREIYSKSCSYHAMKHISHLKPFTGDRIEKEGYIYATLDRLNTYGLPKVALMNYTRQYSAICGFESGITPPPNSSRSDPGTFFADFAQRQIKTVQYSTMRFGDDEILSGNQNPCLSQEETTTNPYILSDDLVGFQGLWDAFQPGDYVQELRSVKGIEIWSEELCIHQRQNCPKKEFIYLRAQSDITKKQTFKIAYNLGQRTVKLRKWVGFHFCSKPNKLEILINNQCDSQFKTNKKHRQPKHKENAFNGSVGGQLHPGKQVNKQIEVSTLLLLLF